jgi:hypothetical protein
VGVKYLRAVACIAICLVFASCDYIAETTSGGGEDDTIGSGEGESILATTRESEVEQEEEQPEEPPEEEPVDQEEESPPPTKEPVDKFVIDDWGQRCPIVQSESCGTYGSGLVPAHDEKVGNGWACGEGVASGKMVVGEKWGDC